MMKEQLINTLSLLHHLLAPIKSNWIIIGTTGLMLSGYNVQPNDIDILTDTETASAINSLLKPYQQLLQLKDDGKFSSSFSRYVIDGISIELMGDLHVNTTTGWVAVLPLINNPDQVELNGVNFLVPSKTEQTSIYSLFGRQKDKAALKLLGAI